MSYEFPADVQKIIQDQISSGGYSSADEVLRDALQALAEQQEMLLVTDPVVTEGIRRGLADFEAGRCRRLDEFDAEFRSQRGIREDV